MPKYCRAPNCSNTAGRLGSDNRPVSFYKFPLKDGPRLQAWLRHMGREHWVPSCHQHVCSEHFPPSCFQWRWGVRYLRPGAVPSVFSQAPPAKSPRRIQSTQKPGSPREAVPSPGDSAAAALPPLRPCPPAAAGPLPGDARLGDARLGAVLQALQRRLRSLQRRRQRQEAQLQGLEQLAGQLCLESLRARQGPPWMAPLPKPEESQTITIICGGPNIIVVLAQHPASPVLDAKAEVLDIRTPSA
ncbi:THAP domain-containing protein 8 [Ctenodactylus gundi]